MTFVSRSLTAVDHRRASARVQRRHAAAQERPRERDVARAVAGDEPQRGAHHLVLRSLQVAHVQIQVELVVERSQRRDVRLDRQVAVERRLAEGMIADARQTRLAGIGLVAAEPLGQHVADLQVLGLFRRTERQEQLRVHAQRTRFQAKADQQRRAFRQPGIDAPGAPAPRAAGGHARRRLVARRIETVPRDVGLWVPVQALALAVELAEHRHFRRELERKAPLDESLLLRLIRAQQPCRVVTRLAHSPPLRSVVPSIGPEPARPPRTGRSRLRNRARPMFDRDRTAPLRGPLAGHRRHR